jgi:hypothetical protein
MPRTTLKHVKDAADAVTKTRAKLADQEAKRDQLTLKAYEDQTMDAPVTYNDLAGALGKTRDRISQILNEQRKIRAKATASA